MRYLKDDIRESILEVSLNEFYEKGFEKSKISIIAEKVHISQGNIYRYYKSKKDIIKNIYIPIEEKIDALMWEHNPWQDEELNTKDLVEKLISLIEEYPREFYILATTNLANSVKKRLVNKVSARQVKRDYDDEYAFIKASLIIDGILLLVKRHIKDLENMKYYIWALINTLFKDEKIER